MTRGLLRRVNLDFYKTGDFSHARNKGPQKTNLHYLNKKTQASKTFFLTSASASIFPWCLDSYQVRPVCKPTNFTTKNHV